MILLTQQINTNDNAKGPQQEAHTKYMWINEQKTQCYVAFEVVWLQLNSLHTILIFKQASKPNKLHAHQTMLQFTIIIFHKTIKKKDYYVEEWVGER